jgi:hypothetical protein
MATNPIAGEKKLLNKNNKTKSCVTVLSVEDSHSVPIWDVESLLRFPEKQSWVCLRIQQFCKFTLFFIWVFEGIAQSIT